MIPGGVFVFRLALMHACRARAAQFPKELDLFSRLRLASQRVPIGPTVARPARLLWMTC